MTKTGPSERQEKDLTSKVLAGYFRGTTMAYALRPTEHRAVVCNYVLDMGGRNIEQTRAYRESERLKGRAVPSIDGEALRRELFVVPGVGMTARDVVRALRQFIKLIEEDGMMVGVNAEDEYLKERVGRSPRFVEC
jgi:hypothetical protein